MLSSFAVERMDGLFHTHLSSGYLYKKKLVMHHLLLELKKIPFTYQKPFGCRRTRTEFTTTISNLVFDYSHGSPVSRRSFLLSVSKQTSIGESASVQTKFSVDFSDGKLVDAQTDFSVDILTDTSVGESMGVQTDSSVGDLIDTQTNTCYHQTVGVQTYFNGVDD